ncbi:MAG: hypothetical protein HY923_11770 [Elusimicrobia bacterium]|nr:hypothetical protein [Elusimicrobiota bacterium]
MRQFVFAALALFAAASASALSPETETFLKGLKIDPQSADIQAIAADVVANDEGEEVSLDTLAAKRDEMGVKRFVATRKFVKAYMKNTKTPFPERKLYEISFLKPNEVIFILDALKKPFTALA